MDRRLMAETHRARLAFVATVILGVIGGILIIGQAYLLSDVIASVFLEQANLSQVTTSLIGLLILILLRSANGAAASWTASEVAIRVKHDLRNKLTEHILKLGPAYTQQERSGELTITATEGIETLDGFFRDYLPALFTSILIPLAILVVAASMDLLTFIVLLITGPLVIVFMVLIGMVAAAYSHTRYAQLGQMSAHFLDVMQGLFTLKLFNRSKAQIQTITHITDQYRESTMNVLRVAFLSAFMLEFMATISVAVVAVEIGLRLLAGGIPFQQALFLLVIAPEFYMPLRNLGAKFHTGRDSAAAAERIYAILNTPLPEQAGDSVITDIQRIQFEQVSHAYADGTRPALADVSFTIERGQHVAIVGATGSGKSTLMHLLLRFIQPSQGTIRVHDGQLAHNLTALDAAAWRQQIAWVPQRSYLFNMSITDNIRIGQPEATQEQIVQAAKAAAAHDFIIGFPQGYDTLVGENGARLSGGQAQRVALARMFLRHVPVYIFDEATASLDQDNEAQVKQAIEQHTAGSMVITIAHRLNTVAEADHILVLDGGHIVEQGNHAELIQAQGAYFHLLQAYGETIHAGQ
ncbi:MAG: thiol reductant ABC exporter subunit CydD [Anaerolineaceae bacterium]|nr:thiol reductant ABC exporter subunit CydD [Anaerolineaceae bacterium]